MCLPEGASHFFWLNPPFSMAYSIPRHDYKTLTLTGRFGRARMELWKKGPKKYLELLQ